MKYRFYIPVFTSLLVFSTCAKKENATPASKNTTVPVAVHAAIPLEKTANALDGIWISHDYLTTIEKTKQIYANAAHKATLFGFMLYKDKMLAGKPDMEGFNTFEGGYIYPLLYNNAGYFELDNVRRGKYPESDNMQVRPLADGNAEITYTKSGKKDVFRKISGSDKVDENILNNTISSMIFNGTYKDKLTGKKITFTYGRVSGMGKLNLFGVMYAFEERNFDEIYFGSDQTTENTVNYHFVYSNGAIRLYKVLPPAGNNDTYTYSKTPSYILMPVQQ